MRRSTVVVSAVELRARVRLVPPGNSLAVEILRHGKRIDARAVRARSAQ